MQPPHRPAASHVQQRRLPLVVLGEQFSGPLLVAGGAARVGVLADAGEEDDLVLVPLPDLPLNWL